MKLPKVIRPEIDISFKRYRDLPLVVSVIVRRMVMSRTLDITINGVPIQIHRMWVIPKYKIKKVSELSTEKINGPGST